MRTINAPRPWPPHPTQELMRLLSDYRNPARRGPAERHPNLKVALDELDAWIADPRRYDLHHHRHAWESLTQDLTAALATRGKALCQATPALDDLRTQLSDPALATDQALQSACKPTAGVGEQQLRQPDAAIAAFDDVYSTIRDAASPTVKVSHRMQALQATLQSAERSLEVEGSLLASVLDDSAMQIAWVHHHLENTPLPEGGHWDDAAGLTPDERLDLCRRLLATSPQIGSQVVWFAYGNGRVTTDWDVTIGPVSFFDGPELVAAIKQAGGGAGETTTSHLNLPRELLDDDEAQPSDDPSTFWPQEVDHWVAVRVELEPGKPYADPISTARDQSDVLVRLASFHLGGTSWQPYSGHRHYVDGTFRSGSYPIGPELDYSIENDRTDEQLEELRPELAGHLPVQNAGLHELLRAAGVLDSSAKGHDPTALLHDVRTIELLASRCGTSNWRYHLTTTFAVHWARRHILQELHASVAGALDEINVHDSSLPQRRDLRSLAPGTTDRYVIRYDVCLAALPRLAEGLPDYHRATRRLRTVHRKLRNSAALGQWIKDLVSEYGRLVARLSRCRNSLAHGGPIDLRVAATVHRFGNSQAKLTTSIGLWAVVAGESVTDAHDKHKNARDSWRKAIPTLATVADAVLPPLQVGLQPSGGST